MSKNNQLLRNLPSVNKIIESINPIQYNLPYSLILKTVRNYISDFRKDILSNNKSNLEELFPKLKFELEKINCSSLQTVINGSGIILHTGLGRAPISKEILESSFDKLSG